MVRLLTWMYPGFAAAAAHPCARRRPWRRLNNAHPCRPHPVLRPAATPDGGPGKNACEKPRGQPNCSFFTCIHAPYGIASQHVHPWPQSAPCREMFSLKPFVTAIVLGTAMLAAPAAQAGCLSGAAIGAAAGHFLGHRLLGAAAGCAVGHHEAKAAADAAARAQAGQQQENAPANLARMLLGSPQTRY